MATMFEKSHFHKMDQSVLPEIIKTGTATPSQCAELETEFDLVSLDIQSIEEIEDIEEIAEWLQAIKEALIPVLKQHNTLTQSVDKLQAEVERLKKEVASLKNELLEGQIVSCFERKMVTEILTGVVELPTQKVTLRELEKILNNDPSWFLPEILETKEQKEQVKVNWKNFAQKHQINNSHFKCIKDLKKQRNKKAHPNLPINEAKKKLRAANLDENDRKMCMEMLETMEKMGIRTIDYY